MKVRYKMNVIIEWYLNNLEYTLLISMMIILGIISILGFKLTNFSHERIVAFAGMIASIPLVIFLYIVNNEIDAAKPAPLKYSINDYLAQIFIFLIPVMIYLLMYYNAKKLWAIMRIQREEKERKRLEREQKEKKNKW